jgi:hypothetical protein
LNRFNGINSRLTNPGRKKIGRKINPVTIILSSNSNKIRSLMHDSISPSREREREPRLSPRGKAVVIVQPLKSATKNHCRVRIWWWKFRVNRWFFFYHHFCSKDRKKQMEGKENKRKWTNEIWILRPQMET